MCICDGGGVAVNQIPCCCRHVFDFVILVDGVKRDNLALMEFPVHKPFSDDCTRRENRNRWWRSCCAVVFGCGWGGHPLNSEKRHPLSLLGGGT